MPQRQSVVVVALIGLGALGTWAWQQTSPSQQVHRATAATAAPATGPSAAVVRTPAPTSAQIQARAATSAVTLPAPQSVPPLDRDQNAGKAESAFQGDDIPSATEQKFARGLRDNR